jgi:hypothetical protein
MPWPSRSRVMTRTLSRCRRSPSRGALPECLRAPRRPWAPRGPRRSTLPARASTANVRPRLRPLPLSTRCRGWGGEAWSGRPARATAPPAAAAASDRSASTPSAGDRRAAPRRGHNWHASAPGTARSADDPSGSRCLVPRETRLCPRQALQMMAPLSAARPGLPITTRGGSCPTSGAISACAIPPLAAPALVLRPRLSIRAGLRTLAGPSPTRHVEWRRRRRWRDGSQAR